MQCAEQPTSSPGVRVFRALARDVVIAHLRRWAADLGRQHPEIVRVGVFGSHARGDYGPGSDLDLVIIVRQSAEPRWYLRGAAYDTSALPIGADVFVHTEAEVGRMVPGNPWLERILAETVWVA